MKRYFYLLCLCLLFLSCAQNKLTNSDLVKLFPQRKNPEIFHDDYYPNRLFNMIKSDRITKVTGDFNGDKILDMAIIAHEREYYNPDSLSYYFFAIISFPKGKDPKLELMIDSLIVWEEAIGLSIDSNNELTIPDGSAYTIVVKWVKDHYEIERFVDGITSDESLLIHFIEFPQKPSVLIYLSKVKFNQQTEWSGYDPSHKKFVDEWTYFTKYDSTSVAFSPDMGDDWNHTFSFCDEIKLLLVTDGPNIDSLAEIYWGADNTESIEEIMNKIGKENILKIWDIKKLTPYSDDWYLSYP